MTDKILSISFPYYNPTGVGFLLSQSWSYKIEKVEGMQIKTSLHWGKDSGYSTSKELIIRKGN